MGKCCCCGKETDNIKCYQLTDGEICDRCYIELFIADSSFDKSKLLQSKCDDVKNILNSAGINISETATEKSDSVINPEPDKNRRILTKGNFFDIIEIVFFIMLIIFGYSFSDRIKEVKKGDVSPPDNVFEEAADKIIQYAYELETGESPDPYIESIKSANMTGYDFTYNQAFSNFFANPKWSHFTSDDGFEVIEFTGNCEYDNQQVKALIQFKITKEIDDYVEWEINYLSFNNVSQNIIMLSALLQKTAEEYMLKQ